MTHNNYPFVDIIAPAGKVHLPARFEMIEEILQTWGYQARFGKNLSGDHPFLSNTTERRFEDLHQALYAQDSAIIWCYRGGNGSSELLPLLEKLSTPPPWKLFLGFSDITALHIFFNQQWKWTTFHGPGAKQIIPDAIDAQSLHCVHQLFKKPSSWLFENDLSITPMNNPAQQLSKLSGVIAGGNLTIIMHSLGTPYQIHTDDKILLLEDVNEPAYKIRRMLTHLTQAKCFEKVKAILLGEFMQADTQEKYWIEQELQTFANNHAFPVFKTNGIGHGKTNYVIPLGHAVNIENILS